MTRFYWLLMAGALLIAPAAHGVTVSGAAYLWGREQHSGTQALFTARSPSARTDSAYTNSAGHFSLELAAGIYDVRYAHAGFASYQLRGQSYLSSAHLDSVTLLQPVSGYLNGSLAGDYQVVDTIRIADRGYVYLAPGTRLLFDGPHPFIVNGWLEAIGTALDSVVFTRRYPTEESCWGGIRFENNPSGSSCRMEFCVVEWARKPNPGSHPGSRGGGIYIAGCSPTFRNCAIRRNHATGNYDSGGGGVAIEYGSPRFEECTITENSSGASWMGAVYCGSGEARFERCLISENTCGGIRIERASRAVFDGCAILNNSGEIGGVSVNDDSSAVFRNCLIADNEAYFYAGVSLSNSSAILERCLITRNRGGVPGLYCSGGAPRVMQCTIMDNTSILYPLRTVYFWRTAAEISSCIIEAAPQGTAVYFGQSPVASVRFSNVVGEPDSAFGFYGGNPENGPPGIGIVALTNANGDSCDTYYNIFLDPQLADTAAGDYRLTAGSPCIDAGDPALPYDPDGTIADIGAFYFHQLAAEEERTAVRGYDLKQNYPNPFNAQTRIGLEIAHPGIVRLEVFDLLGRRVRTLLDAPLPAGAHTVAFDAGNLPSGVYVYRLTAGDAMDAKKMVVLK